MNDSERLQKLIACETQLYADYVIEHDAADAQDPNPRAHLAASLAYDKSCLASAERQAFEESIA